MSVYQFKKPGTRQRPVNEQLRGLRFVLGAIIGRDFPWQADGKVHSISEWKHLPRESRWCLV